MHRRPSPLLLASISGLTLLIASPAIAQDAPTHDQRWNSLVSPFQRSVRSPVPALTPPERGGGPGGSGNDTARFPDEFRTIDATFNNLIDPFRGAAGATFLRLTPNAYADGVGEPAGADRPSARAVSNAVVAQTESLLNPLGASDYVWQWGQFLDHDVDETPLADPAEAFNIAIPIGDPWFDPFVTGEAVIPLSRSAYSFVSGVREQVNALTAYIDASQVYGSDEERAHELRTLDGTGRLKTSEGDLLPFNVNGLENAPTAYDPSYFIAGDIRANEQVGLTALHTLFMREHNHWADTIRADNPEMTGDEIFERARAIVAAEMQAITYREFLPVLLGPGAIPPYGGYRPDLDAGISNVFATAAYRVGHSMLSTQILRLDASGEPIAAGPLSLSDAFFAPQVILDDGIEPLLRGLAHQTAQKVDNYVVDDIRNFLFGAPGSGGFDLASLNIQRGRDHGLPSYNQVRVAFGRPPVTSFAQINPDPEVAARLASVYDSVSDIDAWVGLLAEPLRPGALVGETHTRVLADQFRRLRDADRFWYAAYLPDPMVAMINQQTLATIIRRNTPIGDEIPENVFFVETGCIADLAPPYGQLDFSDVSAFITAFAGEDPDADLAPPFGQWTFADVSAFLTEFGAGCP